MSDRVPQLESESEPDQDVRLALDAVAAIQRLIAERNELRGQLAVQDRELARLRRSLSNIRETYRRLTCDFVRQLQYIDGTIGDLQSSKESAQGIAPRAEGPISSADPSRF